MTGYSPKSGQPKPSPDLVILPAGSGATSVKTCDECGSLSEELDKCGCPLCDGGDRAPLICGDCARKPVCPGPSLPPILCSQCGKPLQRRLRAFECEPCGRVVAC